MIVSIGGFAITSYVMLQYHIVMIDAIVSIILKQ